MTASRTFRLNTCAGVSDTALQDHCVSSVTPGGLVAFTSGRQHGGGPAPTQARLWTTTEWMSICVPAAGHCDEEGLGARWQNHPQGGPLPRMSEREASAPRRRSPELPPGTIPVATGPVPTAQQTPDVSDGARRRLLGGGPPCLRSRHSDRGGPAERADADRRQAQEGDLAQHARGAPPSTRRSRARSLWGPWDHPARYSNGTHPLASGAPGLHQREPLRAQGG